MEQLSKFRRGLRACSMHQPEADHCPEGSRDDHRRERKVDRPSTHDVGMRIADGIDLHAWDRRGRNLTSLGCAKLLV